MELLCIDLCDFISVYKMGTHVHNLLLHQYTSKCARSYVCVWCKINKFIVLYIWFISGTRAPNGRYERTFKETFGLIIGRIIDQSQYAEIFFAFSFSSISA